MTIYEQIERAVDRAERADLPPPSQAEGAREAGMGERSFRSWFWAVTGHTWRGYLTGRRLATAAAELEATDKPILEIALDAGYETHEAFSRAFARAFGVSPRAYRRRGGAMDPALPARLEKIELYGEKFMGAIIKELGAMRAAYFDAFQPNPEDKARLLLKEWLASRPEKSPRRVFGHNINADGTVCLSPEYAGYRFYATLAEGESAGDAGETLIRAGTFAVTGIEGSFAEDPEGKWIGQGWRRMNDMVAQKGYRVKAPPRWFEEELEPREPGNLRLDLYLEIER